MKKLLAICLFSLLALAHTSINSELVLADKGIKGNTVTLNPDFKVHELAPNFKLKGIDGKDYSLSDYKGKFVVVEWFNSGCPFVKKHYAKEQAEKNMPSMQAKYTQKGVVWLTVVSSTEGKQGNMTPAEHKKIYSSWGLKSTAMLIDEEAKVAANYRAKTTPYIVVVDKEGKVAYEGAVDNKPTAEPADLATATNYVQTALDELLASKKVSLASTESYGCSVKY
jgi:peroxiredoxin